MKLLKEILWVSSCITSSCAQPQREAAEESTLRYGRLKWNAEVGRLEIDCNFAGAGFVAAASELRLEELGDLVCPKLSYQQLAPRKLKNLQLHHEDQPLIIIQELSINNTIVGTPFRNHSSLPPKKSRQSHHQQPVQIQLDHLFCHQCQVHCTTTKDLKKHCKGKKHKSMVQLLKSQKYGVGPKAVICHVCMISCTDEISFQLHISGKQHASRLEAINAQAI